MFDRKFLPLILLVSGTINVLLIKLADKQISKGSDGKFRSFEHPFIQTIVLFFGEFLCFILYKILFLYLSRKRDGSEDTNILTSGEREFSPLIFIFPTCCDLIASYLFFIGLCLTYPSSYQMLKGISLIFVGIFSVSYFDLKFKNHHWFGILILILSAILICISDVNNINPVKNLIDSNGLLTGDLLILIGIIFRSLQIVYEEKKLKILNIPPLQMIGWEGIYGLLISIFLIIPMNFIKINEIPFFNNPNNVIEDINDAIIQIFNNIYLILCHLFFIIFIILETFSCKYIIKDASCTGVIIIQNINVIFIWILSLSLGWEYFYYLELIALIILFFGICIYKNIVFGQVYRWLLVKMLRRHDDENEEVINQPADAVNI